MNTDMNCLRKAGRTPCDASRKPTRTRVPRCSSVVCDSSLLTRRQDPGRSMKSMGVHCLLLLALVVLMAAGCRPESERCRKCGMLVDQHPRWIAGLTNGEGKEERFCCERCMFAHWRGPQGAGSRDAWVTEYYQQKRLPVADVLFVLGSDVTGPMGKTLVPIAGRDAAEQFLKDHHGTRIVTAEEITVELLREVAGKPAGAHR